MKSNDIKSFTDPELISTILKIQETEKDHPKRTNPVIKNILATLNQRKELTSFEDLTANYGIGSETALKVLACFEVARRYQASGDPSYRITQPEDCLKLLDPYREKKQEHFIAFTLNGAGEVIGNRVITIGLLNHSLVHPREVFADAVTDRAASIIVAHNHPSGSLEPSSQDIAITTQLKEAGAILGIQLIDHLIVTKTGHVSMRERGLV